MCTWCSSETGSFPLKHKINLFFFSKCKSKPKEKNGWTICFWKKLYDPTSSELHQYSLTEQRDVTCSCCLFKKNMVKCSSTERKNAEKPVNLSLSADFLASVNLHLLQSGNLLHSIHWELMLTGLHDYFMITKFTLFCSIIFQNSTWM